MRYVRRVCENVGFNLSEKAEERIDDLIRLAIVGTLVFTSRNPFLCVVFAVVLFAPLWLVFYTATNRGKKKAKRVFERKIDRIVEKMRAESPSPPLPSSTARCPSRADGYKNTVHGDGVIRDTGGSSEGMTLEQSGH